MSNTVIENPVLQPLKKASNILGLSEYSLRQGVKTGQIPHLRIGNKIYINMPQLMEQIEKQTSNSLIKL